MGKALRSSSAEAPLSNKIIITCALTGSAETYRINPAVPITPQQIANAALEAESAGASIVHAVVVA